MAKPAMCNFLFSSGLCRSKPLAGPGGPGIVADDIKVKEPSIKYLTPLPVLSYQDSNLDRQNQKLQCYHYTIRQSSLPRVQALKQCKVKEFF